MTKELLRKIFKLNPTRLVSIMLLANIYDIVVTYIFAFTLGMGIYNERNPFVRYFWGNGMFKEWFIFEFFITTGILTWYYFVIRFTNWNLDNILLVDYKGNKKVYHLYFLLRAITLALPLIFFIGGSTWIIGYID